jgi:hypothetical protein
MAEIRQIAKNWPYHFFIILGLDLPCLEKRLKTPRNETELASKIPRSIKFDM